MFPQPNLELDLGFCCTILPRQPAILKVTFLVREQTWRSHTGWKSWLVRFKFSRGNSCPGSNQLMEAQHANYSISLRRNGRSPWQKDRVKS